MHFSEEYVHHGTTIPAGQYVRIAVKDNGTGIDPAIQPRIFEPFFTTKPVGQGTGLGLSVAHGIIHSHNGYIALQSAPGAGSTFEIFLPASSAAEPAAAAPAPPATAIDGGRRMVYIDDDEAMRFMVVRLLSRRGFNVSAFESGAGALAAVTADPDAFDFVITDYNMPQQSGIEVARALREIRPNLPIMLISGYITDEMREDARQIGIQRVLEKQNSIAELVDAIIASLHP
jgi:CheY-like chemotaxis protein